jgi:acyl-[acyl carrier protein]--UDP-N-acetylglucosamine O-acyltransferase
MVGGDRARLRGVNRVGITRRGFDPKAKREIKEIIRQLKGEGIPVGDIVSAYAGRDDLTPEACRLLSFLSGLERGLTR